MTGMIRFFGFIIASLLLLAVPAMSMPPGPMDSAAKIMSQPRYAHAVWGYYVADLKTGESIAALNPDKWFVPGSTTKLFSCAAIMELLGPDYRFKTPVYANGALGGDGVLQGDLILVASGDLNMGGRRGPDGKLDYPLPDHTESGVFNFSLTKGNPLAGLEELAKQIKALGINRVLGEVVIDHRLFATTMSPDDRYWLSPIMINDNYVDITLTPGAPGEKPTLRWRPKTKAVKVTNQVKTGPKDSEPQVEAVWAPFGEIVVKGRIPANGKPFNAACQTDQPGLFARALFIEALQRAGVEQTADPGAGNPTDRLPKQDRYKTMERVALLESPPLTDNIEMILKISHNLHATTLPMLIAAHKGVNDYDQGMAAEGDLLKKIGFDPASVCLSDGAGGPVGNRISPKAATALVRAMSKRPWFGIYVGCLPVMGVDGTLAHAVAPDSPVRGKAKAKTGTILRSDPLNDRVVLQAKAMAGVMTTAGGREVAFAIYVNNAPLEEIKDMAAVGQDLGAVAQAIYKAY